MTNFSATPSQQVSINGFAANVASSALTATPAGALIVVAMVNQLASGSALSVTDNVGNTYVMAPLANPGTNQRHVALWYCLNAAAGVTQVTVNNSASTNVGGDVLVWNSGASSLRGAASLNNAGSTTPPAANVSANADDLVIGLLGYQAAVASTRQETLNSGSGFAALTPVTRGTTTMFAGAYKVASSSGSQGPSWSMSPSVSTGELTVAFVPNNPAPIANAGPDQAAVESFATATLDGTGSSAQSGTIASYAWSQTSGPAVTLSSSSASMPTFKAPGLQAGATLVFQLVVTDSNGTSSTADTVSITVLPATEFHAQAGAWVALETKYHW